MNWISVKEKLPFNEYQVVCRDVLVCCDYGIITVASYMALGDNYYWISQSGDVLLTVTHWQNLPELPKKEI